jgi:hypothetical protein
VVVVTAAMGTAVGCVAVSDGFVEALLWEVDVPLPGFNKHPAVTITITRNIHTRIMPKDFTIDRMTSL